MRNPISNAVELVESRKLVACKNCACPNLAWVNLKTSGRWVLCATSSTRPYYRGENQAPTAPQGMIYAVKTAVHRCDVYRANLERATSEHAEMVRRQELCHPKADNPAEILHDAMGVVMVECARDKYQQLQAGDGPLFDAMEIFLKLRAEIGKGL